MDRKKTILVAVMINAGLLIVLFIAALASQEDAAVEEIAQKPPSGPLFSDAADLVLHEPSAPISNTAVFAATPEAPPIVETPILHKLPPVETASQPTPIAAEKVVSAASPYIEVTVRKGDSLDKIAKAHNTTVEEIVKINQLPGSFLKIGQILKIPDGKNIARASIKPKPALEKPAVAGPEYYTVKVGDNPWSIAMKHHMKVEELLKINQLNEERARKLKPGDRLRIR